MKAVMNRNVVLFCLGIFFLFACNKNVVPTINPIATGGIVLKSPANGAVNQPIQPIFQWNITNTNIKYTVIYYGTSPATIVPDQVNTNYNNTSDTIRLSPGAGIPAYLNYGTQYYWRVIGLDINGLVVDTTPIQSFTIRPAINLLTARGNLGVVVYKDTLYAMGGTNSMSNNSVAFANVEKLNGTSWVASTAMPTPRNSLAVAVYKDTLYAVGGYNYNGNAAVDSVEKWDGTNWTSGAPTLTPRAGLGLSAYHYNNDTLLYAVGGVNGSSVLSSVEVWNGINWTQSSPISTPSYSLGLAVYNNNLYAVGGLTGSSSDISPPSDIVEFWNGITWTLGTPLTYAISGLGMVAYNNNLYVMGAVNGGYSLQIWNGATWSTGPAMPTVRTNLGLAIYNNLIYAVGGFVGLNPSSAVDIYNPSTNQWQ